MIVLSGSAAASRMERHFGLCASRLASTAISSAKVPCRPPTPPTIPKTSSPDLKAVTLPPTSSIVPAISRPSTAGSGCLACAAWPARIFRVEWIDSAGGYPDQDVIGSERRARDISCLKLAARSIDEPRFMPHGVLL